MATAPYFVLSPNTILSVLGLLRGPDTTTPTPIEDWRRARVDVVIPVLNEAGHIALCLASILRQTMQPRRIIVVDDGSTDATGDVVEAFARVHHLDIAVIKRRAPIGKTPTVKRQARESDADVEFILDADTVLESEDYLARTVEELYKAAGVASVCGTIQPLRRRDRRAWIASAPVQAFARGYKGTPFRGDHWWRDLLAGATNLYRDVLHSYLQRFIYRGQSVYFGTTANPVGCAVAYRRKYVEELFDHFSPQLGDDLTNSEDIFIGLALVDKGYRNVHLPDVQARTVEPPIHRLPRQIYLWSSSFLQSCYYFDPLVKSPFRLLRARPSRRSDRRDVQVAAPVAAAPAGGAVFSTSLPAVWGPTLPVPAPLASEPVERRRIAEPYRQAFGRDLTAAYGRRAGWMLMMSAVEKVFFPATLLILILLHKWEALIVTFAAETAIGLLALFAVMKGERIKYVLKGMLVAPLRYALMFSELFTLGRFAVDLWIRKDRRWRK